MKQKIPVVIALIVMISAAGGMLFYLHKQGQGEREFREMRESKEETWEKLLRLNKKNPDTIGWIEIDDTKISYPVMKGETYLYKNTKKEYSESGTPFVQDDWTQYSKNSLIYGHNMWVEHTMFNPLHKYEKKKYWKKHKYGTFYVICESPSGGKRVEARKFAIAHIILTSTEDTTWTDAGNETDTSALYDYLTWCGKNEMYDTDRSELTDDGLVTLCTCSYHIPGKRSYGRILVVGTITLTKIVSAE